MRSVWLAAMWALMLAMLVTVAAPTIAGTRCGDADADTVDDCTDHGVSGGAPGTLDITTVVTAADDIIDIDINGETDTLAFNNATLTNVPEPATMALLAIGLGGLALAGGSRSR
jgi:hypothetical protein